MPDDAQNVLSPLQVDNSVKANAWEAYNSAKDETDLQVKLMGMKELPEAAKADLWEAKKRSAVSPEQSQISQLPNPAQQSKQQLLSRVPGLTRDAGLYPQSLNTSGDRDAAQMKSMLSGATGTPDVSYVTPGQAKAGIGTGLAAGSLMAAPGATITSAAGAAVGDPLLKAVASKVGASPGEAEMWGTTGGIIGGLTGGSLYGPAKGLLPSTKSASAGFQAVSRAVGSHTVDASAAGQVALEAKSLGDAGGRMPKVLSNFLQRATDPEKGPITYDEARLFYQNATKQSTAELTSQNPLMRAKVAQFTRELGNSLEETAGRAGKAEQLRQSMAEYSSAKKLQGAGDTTKQFITDSILKKAAEGGALTAGGAGIYGLLKSLGIVGK